MANGRRGMRSSGVYRSGRPKLRACEDDNDDFEMLVCCVDYLIIHVHSIAACSMSSSEW